MLGASGLIGGALLDRLTSARAIGTYNRTPISGGLRFDARRQKLAQVIDDPGEYSHAALLLGQTGMDACASDIQASDALNLAALKDIIDQLNAWHIRLIFLSTDMVFDGKGAPFTENARAAPIITYGRQKREVERHIERSGADYIILRLGRVFADQANAGTFLGEMFRDLLNGEKIRCARDQVFNPVHLMDVVEVIVEGMRRGLGGLYHLGGPDRVNRLELLEMLAGEMGRHRQLGCEIEPCRLADLPFLETRPTDTTLDTTKLEGEGLGPRRRLADSCRAIVSRHFGDDGLQAARGNQAP